MRKKLPKPSDIPSSFLTIKQAVKHFDISERTLRRDMAAGKINPHKDKRGWNYFDPSDLSREYGVKKETQVSDNIGQNSDMAEVDRPNDIPLLHTKIKGLEREIEVLKQLGDEKDKRVEKLEADKEKWDAEKQKFWDELKTKNLLLEDQRKRAGNTDKEQPRNWLGYGIAATLGIVSTVVVVALVLLFNGTG